METILNLLTLFVVIIVPPSALHARYGEIWRPMIGLILRRKPLVPKLVAGIDFFKAVLGEEGISTVESLSEGYGDIKEAIQLKSWFRKDDLQRASLYYTQAYFLISIIEAMRLRAEEAAKAEPEKVPVAGWRKILGLAANEENVEVIKHKYRKLVRNNHTDLGGDGTKMAEYNAAMAAARAELSFI